MPKLNGEDLDYINISRTVGEFREDEDEFCSTVHAFMRRGYKCTGGITQINGRVYQSMVKEN